MNNLEQGFYPYEQMCSHCLESGYWEDEDKCPNCTFEGHTSPWRVSKCDACNLNFIKNMNKITIGGLPQIISCYLCRDIIDLNKIVYLKYKGWFQPFHSKCSDKWRNLFDEI